MPDYAVSFRRSAEKDLRRLDANKGQRFCAGPRPLRRGYSGGDGRNVCLRVNVCQNPRGRSVVSDTSKVCRNRTLLDIGDDCEILRSPSLR